MSLQIKSKSPKMRHLHSCYCLQNLAIMKKQQKHMDSFKKVLYLIKKECHLRAYIDIHLFKVSWMTILWVIFLLCIVMKSIQIYDIKHFLVQKCNHYVQNITRVSNELTIQNIKKTIKNEITNNQLKN